MRGRRDAGKRTEGKVKRKEEKSEKDKRRRRDGTERGQEGGREKGREGALSERVMLMRSAPSSRRVTQGRMCGGPSVCTDLPLPPSLRHPSFILRSPREPPARNSFLWSA